MIEVAQRSIELQDMGDVDGIVELFAEDCTFMMPVLREPLRGREALRKNVQQSWPKAITHTEWIAIDGNRLVCVWNWRGEGWPEDTPLLRGISTFVFNDDGLVQDYEDFFDPDWLTRHSAQRAWAGPPSQAD
jgi:hypothetical protein